MKALGIDIGNLTTKVVILDNKKILYRSIETSTDDSDSSANEAIGRALKDIQIDASEVYVVATGAGRKFVSASQAQKATTTCLARGIYHLFPSVRTAMDMGGETGTVIKIHKQGRLSDWANHDKCAAGTGVFLQQVSKIMQISMKEMSDLSLQAKRRADISGTCAVFAESEIVSHIHRMPPTPREEIVAGVYFSMVNRAISLCKRVGIEKDVAVSGGVALNAGLIKILEQELDFQVMVPEEPQIIAALGAAIIAQEHIEGG
jgi:(R)-2-hydroxyacyl-CoA dehydratese activating ATPase